MKLAQMIRRSSIASPTHLHMIRRWFKLLFNTFVDVLNTTSSAKITNCMATKCRLPTPYEMLHKSEYISELGMELVDISIYTYIHNIYIYK